MIDVKSRTSLITMLFGKISRCESMTGIAEEMRTLKIILYFSIEHRVITVPAKSSPFVTHKNVRSE